MQDKTRETENKGNIIPLPLLTSARHPHYSGIALIETATPETKRGKDNRKAAYPLRFKNKTQKERLERAARKTGLSLRDFILKHAEIAAESLNDGLTKAS